MTRSLKTRAADLRLYGLLAHWGEIAECDWLTQVIAWEEQERHHRSLQRRLAAARIGRFKPLADFDWSWPRRCDRAAIETLMGLAFIDEAANVVLLGPQGVGKSTLAANLAHRAVLEGYTVRFVTAAAMLGELAPSTATARCSAALHCMPDRSCWSSMRSGISPTHSATPTCCSISSADATSSARPSSPPTGRSASGT